MSTRFDFYFLCLTIVTAHMFIYMGTENLMGLNFICLFIKKIIKIKHSSINPVYSNQKYVCYMLM